MISDGYFLHYRDKELSLIPGHGYKIGRNYSDIVLPHGLVSRHHAEIIWQNGQFILIDNQSKNGTKVNGHLVTQHTLSDGDRIKIGCFDLKFIVKNQVAEGVYEDTITPTETLMLEQKLSHFLNEIEDPGIVKGFYELKELYDRKKDKLMDFAYKDPMTGLYNRRFFEERIEAEIARCTRHQRELYLALFDIDHFKKINDAHGHLKGDEVIKLVASIMLANARREDIPVRYGGDELLLVLPETSSQQAFAIAEKLRLSIHQATCDNLGVTISIGIACLNETNNTVTKLIMVADNMLYAAKTRGRNMTVIDKEVIAAENIFQPGDASTQSVHS